MTVFRFIFSFLYTRNWHTGAEELSTPRVVLFSAMLVLVVLAVCIAWFLQMPVSYSIT